MTYRAFYYEFQSAGASGHRTIEIEEMLNGWAEKGYRLVEFQRVTEGKFLVIMGRA